MKASDFPSPAGKEPKPAAADHGCAKPERAPPHPAGHDPSRSLNPPMPAFRAGTRDLFSASAKGLTFAA